MDKAEIEHKLEQAKADKFEINKQVQILEAQLREAEKPKLRHGDFGYSGSTEFPRLVLDKNRLAHSFRVFESTPHDEPTVILGNIFDLLKEWSEDLGEFKIDQTKGGGGNIKICIDSRFIDFWVAGKICTTKLSEAEEIWHKLGQLIATLKRKLQA